MITCGCRLKEGKKKKNFLEMLSFQTKFYTKNLKVFCKILNFRVRKINTYSRSCKMLKT